MKKLLVLLAASALVVQSTQCGLGGLLQKAKEVAQQAKTLTETTKVYKANAATNDKQFTPISIEIRSKPESIKGWVAVRINDTFYTHKGNTITEIKPGKSEQFAVVIDQPYDIFVWKNQPSSTDTKADFRYRFNAEQTAYVNIDPNGSLRPQTGPAKGALKKTDSGFSLENNIKTMVPVAVDIPKAVEPKQAPTAPIPSPTPKPTTVKAPEPTVVAKAPEGVKTQPTSLLEEIRARGQAPAIGEEKAPAVAAAPQAPTPPPSSTTASKS